MSWFMVHDYVNIIDDCITGTVNRHPGSNFTVDRCILKQFINK